MVVKGLTIAHGDREQGCVSTVHSFGLSGCVCLFLDGEGVPEPLILTGVGVTSRARPAADLAAQESLGKKLLERRVLLCAGPVSFKLVIFVPINVCQFQRRRRPKGQRQQQTDQYQAGCHALASVTRR